jgi:hypothetical protein
LHAWFEKHTDGKWKACPFHVTIQSDVFD